jgi:hypothetical protein
MRYVDLVNILLTAIIAPITGAEAEVPNTCWTVPSTARI